LSKYFPISVLLMIKNPIFVTTDDHYLVHQKPYIVDGDVLIGGYLLEHIKGYFTDNDLTLKPIKTE